MHAQRFVFHGGGHSSAPRKLQPELETTAHEVEQGAIVDCEGWVALRRIEGYAAIVIVCIQFHDIGIISINPAATFALAP